MARPRLKIDPEQVRLLASVGCTTHEIAAHLGCSPDTLERRFAAVMEKGREQGKLSLRRKRFQVAMRDGHRAQGTMLVWLSKQMLQEKDRQDVTSDDKALPTVIEVVRKAPPAMHAEGAGA